jgi:hypothetical protein
MATWDDVREIALGLPGTSESPAEQGAPSWKVRDKSFVWDRPLGKKDRSDLGDAAPDGPILGVHVADEGVKAALIADAPTVFFTTPHFDGYPAVLLRLDEIEFDELQELIVEAWLVRAPKKLAKSFLGNGS